MLDKILATKKQEVEKLILPDQADVTFYSLKKALTAEKEKVQVIAEVKKASPSKGIIRSPFYPVEIAQSYKAGGAAALSVLTDVSYFQGHRDYLTAIKREVGLPVLRKDFIIEDVQIQESKRMGADAILLIAAALDPKKLFELYQSAEEQGMEVLVEFHSKQELENVLRVFDPAIIGINNRDLNTFETSLSVTEHLRNEIPSHSVVVSESGIHTQEDLTVVQQAGARAVLVGESLVKQADVEKALRHLKGE
ncbi:indole-3-glycerol phosphate synthase TrpC [Salibacterium salarium]|uniref:Indole-3-glycerol phosphate synthase n=1 Tax=Salibacterium salarium TaxID=284579 RepID=A0A3R9Q526_9BACI|nr:indole-3-glycerol phosphate synthase TrpC [Salibacterium salarium]RSL33807.1 indole-3-glycerol phosphate synthase TrpC [Salibacterium salarium]